MLSRVVKLAQSTASEVEARLVGRGRSRRTSRKSRGDDELSDLFSPHKVLEQCDVVIRLRNNAELLHELAYVTLVRLHQNNG